MNNESTATVIAFLGEFMEFLQAKEAAKSTLAEPTAAVDPEPVAQESGPAAEFVGAVKFAALAEIPQWRAYEFARKNEGTWAHKKDDETRMWQINVEALKFFKKKSATGNPCGKPVPVRCHELNKVFPNLTAASKETKVSISSIRKSTKTGKPTVGYHFSVAI